MGNDRKHRPPSPGDMADLALIPAFKVGSNLLTSRRQKCEGQVRVKAPFISLLFLIKVKIFRQQPVNPQATALQGQEKRAKQRHKRSGSQQAERVTAI